MKIGVDIFCLNRIDLEKQHLITRILTKAEFELFQSLSSNQAKIEFFGGRFAAKEAYIKAGHSQVPYQQIEILNHDNGEPYFTNDENALVSISHEKEYAVAFVISKEGESYD